MDIARIKVQIKLIGPLKRMMGAGKAFSRLRGKPEA